MKKRARSRRSVHATGHDAQAGGAGKSSSALSGIGLRVAVYDCKGHYLGGDKTLRPRLLARMVTAAHRRCRSPTRTSRIRWNSSSREVPDYRRRRSAAAAGIVTRRRGSSRSACVGRRRLRGFCQASLPLLLVRLRRIGSRSSCDCASRDRALMVRRAALCAYQTLAADQRSHANRCARSPSGDYTQRRFVSSSGDEIASLTAAYNDAVASVAARSSERRQTEERMRQFVADAGTNCARR